MKLPYLPKNRQIEYVPENNKFMIAAKKSAENLSLDENWKTGSVIVKNNKIIGSGANGSNFHKVIGCIRNFAKKFVKIKTGAGYWLCPGCRPCHHAEQSAIRNAEAEGHNCEDADLYLWGHWWVCESCWKKIISRKIKHVYLLKDANKKFQ